MTVYSPVARWLHWLIAALIALQFVLARLGEWADADGYKLRELALLANHKSVGMTVLMLAVVRLGWRLLSRVPAAPAAMPAWQQRAASSAHWGLYLLLFALPVSGWLMSSASAYSVSWFNLWVWPDLVQPDKTLVPMFKDFHEWAGKLLFVLALIHIAAALKHALLDRDGVLARMSSRPAIAVALLLFAGGLWALTPAAPETGTVQVDTPLVDPPSVDAPLVDPPLVDVPAAAAVGPSAASDALPLWVIDEENSFIRFSAEQAGAPFTGEWTHWTAEVAFDETRVADSVARVTIYTDAVASGDDERDDTIRGPEFFDADNFQAALYEADRFEQRDGQWVAEGTLTIKNLTLPVALTFTLTDGVLTGSAEIDRLVFNVGTGDWRDPTWVGQTVAVSVQVARLR